MRLRVFEAVMCGLNLLLLFGLWKRMESFSLASKQSLNKAIFLPSPPFLVEAKAKSHTPCLQSIFLIWK